MLDRIVGYRINRATYWTNLIGIVAIVGILVSFGIVGEQGGTGAIEVVLGILAGTRLHDMGYSAKYALAGVILHAILSFTVLARFGYEEALMPLGLLNLAFLVLLVWLGLVPGQSGRNQWGEKPPAGVSWKRPERRYSED